MLHTRIVRFDVMATVALFENLVGTKQDTMSSTGTATTLLVLQDTAGAAIACCTCWIAGQACSALLVICGYRTT